MTMANEQAAKLPLMKRLILAMRGGVGGGLSAMLVVLLVALVIAIGAGGFLGGLVMATKRNLHAEQNLIAQVKTAKQAQAKLLAEKAGLEKELEVAKDASSMLGKDVATLKEQLAAAHVERETMNKVLAEISESLRSGGAAANPKAAAVVKGAMLKFGDKECELEGGAIKSKDDVKCLNLKDAIDAMNSGPGGYGAKPTKPTEAPAAKPVQKGH